MEKHIQLVSFDIGIVNLSYCVIEVKPNELNIVDWGTSDISGDPHRNLINFLDNLCSTQRITRVVIENQSFNKKMVFISHIIYSYFLIKGYPQEYVSFINAIHKIRLITEVVPNYSKRKKMSVEYTRKCIKEPWTSFFESHTKKETLATVFSMGLHSILLQLEKLLRKN